MMTRRRRRKKKVYFRNNCHNHIFMEFFAFVSSSFCFLKDDDDEDNNKEKFFILSQYFFQLCIYIFLRRTHRKYKNIVNQPVNKSFSSHSREVPRHSCTSIVREISFFLFALDKKFSLFLHSNNSLVDVAKMFFFLSPSRSLAYHTIQ